MPRVVPVLALLTLLLATSVSVPATADPARECALRVTDTAPTARVLDGYPRIRVAVHAPCGMHGVHATFLVDGREVTPTGGADGAFTFTPTDALAPGPHTVHARVTTADGRVTRASWEFLVRPMDAPGERVIAHVPGAAGARAVPLHVHDAALLVDGAWARPAAGAHALTVTLQRLRALPPDVTAPPADPFLVMRVDARARLGAPADGNVTFGSGFTGLTLRVSVPLEHLASRGGAPAEAHALAFVDGAWTRLPARDASVNGTHARMNVTLDRPAPVALVVDARAPVVRALAPAHATPVTAPPTIRVSVTDNVALALTEVRVNDRVVHSDRAPAGGVVAARTDPFRLPDGWHTVRVRAEDASGLVTERAWTFALDRAPPTFPRALTGVLDDGRPGFEVDYVDALTGVRAESVRLTLDGRDVTPLARVTPTTAAFTPTMALAPGEHVLVVSVTDRAGNVAETRHAFTLPATATPFPAGVLALALALGVAVLTRRP